MARIKALRTNPIFAEFSDRQIAIISQVVEEMKLNGKQEFSLQPHGLVIVKKGSLCAEFLNGDSPQVTLNAGEFFGEMAFLSNSSTDFSKIPLRVFAPEPCEFLHVDPNRFYSFAPKEPQIALKIIQNVTRSLQSRLLQHQRLLQRLALVKGRGIDGGAHAND